MNSELKRAIERALERNSQSPCQIVAHSLVSGGCINSAAKITLADDRVFFIKSNSDCSADVFLCESQGLAAIAATEAVCVPEVICTGSISKTHFLVLEWIESSRKPKSFFETFGRNLAAMHQSQSVRSNDEFGFFDDNYLGSSIQSNAWNEKWCDFFGKYRLGFQFELAKRNGNSDRSFERLADRLMIRLEELLNVEEAPALIHGDLWSGNYLVGSSGEPVLIDPAVYFAIREAEFGMTTLFGGFPADFYSAYEEVWPLTNGSEERIAIYRLYHLLNHLNLFGSSYMSGCVEIMKRFA